MQGEVGRDASPRELESLAGGSFLATCKLDTRDIPSSERY